MRLATRIIGGFLVPLALFLLVGGFTLRSALALREREEIRRLLSDMRTREEREVAERTREAERDARTAVWAILAGVLACALLLVGGSILLTRAITGPVNRLVRAAERLGRGDLGARIGEGRRDELGELSAAFNRMADRRQHVEEALHAATATFDALVRASPLALVGMDTAGNVTLWNPAAERLFGWSREEVLGNPAPFVPEARREELEALPAGPQGELASAGGRA